MANAVAASVSAQGCPTTLKLSPVLAPVIPTAHGASRHKNVIGERISLTLRSCKPRLVACNSNLSGYPIVLTSRSSQGPQKDHALPAGIQVSQISSTHIPFLGRDQGVVSHTNLNLPGRRISPAPPRAAARDVFGFRLPVLTEKPEWWWRTLACIPYIIALQISDVGFYLQPFSEHYELFENLIYFVPGAITRLPTWFILVYCYIGYIGIVKNKDLPHFFRFHLMMGMLLETALQIVWYTCNFMPLIHYNGRFGMHFWAGVGFAFITVLLQCIRCAVAGSYVQLPLISDAAFIHTLFHIGGFHRPF